MLYHLQGGISHDPSHSPLVPAGHRGPVRGGLNLNAAATVPDQSIARARPAGPGGPAACRKFAGGRKFGDNRGTRLPSPVN
eukprot:766713-Hanusia_phi.AAC.1